jgi:hypothetical protein
MHTKCLHSRAGSGQVKIEHICTFNCLFSCSNLVMRLKRCLVGSGTGLDFSFKDL